MKIERCYDSHLHLLATGQIKTEINLSQLTHLSELGQWVSAFSQRGDWLVGFGWDQHQIFKNKFQMPTKEDLDLYFPNRPVAFSRVDGHALWLNSCALSLVGLLGKKNLESPQGGAILKDQDGNPTGIFLDSAMALIESQIPAYTKEQNIGFLKTAVRELNQQGFSHARDMSGTADQWNWLCQLEDKNDFSLFLEQNFYCEKINDIDQVILNAQKARNEKRRFLRVDGIKFYMDGALGSEGAKLSQPYGGDAKNGDGFTIFTREELSYGIQKAWQAGFSACVHTIGDESVHEVSEIIEELAQKNIKGLLNIEHGEVIRDQTIEKLSNCNVIVHMQPCHWLSDRKWLKQKLGNLYQYAFPWQKLLQKGIKIQFGSDTPIEPCSIKNNITALEQSKLDGIPEFKGNFIDSHSHPDSSWEPNTFSEFKDGNCMSVMFCGEKLL
jgi:predicted amidohydrolase YtcJ